MSHQADHGPYTQSFITSVRQHLEEYFCLADLPVVFCRKQSFTNALTTSLFAFLSEHEHHAYKVREVEDRMRKILYHAQLTVLGSQTEVFRRTRYRSRNSLKV